MAGTRRYPEMGWTSPIFNIPSVSHDFTGLTICRAIGRMKKGALWRDGPLLH